MACKVKVNQHGYLAFRFYWKGKQFWQGTGWRDTDKNRAKAEGKALEISEEIKAGTFNYLKWFPEGNKADEFKPKIEAPADAKSLTVGEYYRDWIERRKPPFVRPGLRHDYVRQFRRYILPTFEDSPLVDIDLTKLDVFRASLNRERGLSLKSCRNIIDGTFRAMMRDVRAKKPSLGLTDHFANLKWKRPPTSKPDPFTAEESDVILNYFRKKHGFYYPFIGTLFGTGARQSETIALRWCYPKSQLSCEWYKRSGGSLCKIKRDECSRKKVVQVVLAGELSKREGAQKLGVTVRSIDRYLCRFRNSGGEGLYDHRQSNHRKIAETDERRIVQAKLHGRHRSARLVRDLLKLPVHEESVRLVFVKHHLERTSLPPVKPIRRFRAAEPNDLWQIDIQGKVHFPLLGNLLLILVKDDHSRFLLSGRWYFHQYKINVFMVLHKAFVHWGIPKAILSDRGSQFKAAQLHGEAEYQYLMRRLGIELIYGRKPRTKGKIENQFRFVQRDFVLENLHHTSLDDLNTAWEKWMDWYDWKHRHKGLNGDSPADHYVKSLRRPTAEELELLLIHEEPRKVTRTGHISYYGQFYRVPDPYIGRRVWTVLKGETLKIESGKEVIARYRIKTEYLKE